MARLYGEYRGDCTRYLFCLTERRLTSPPLVHDLVNNLSARAFYPDQPYEVIVGLCPAGLREAGRLHHPQLRQLLWERAGLNPSAKLTFLSYAELQEASCP